MKQSNIFAYIELNNLVSGLKALASEPCKNKLKSQSAYFSIIEPKYFSDELVNDWNEILSILKYNGPTVGKAGVVMYSEISAAIERLTDEQCQDIFDRVFVLHKKLTHEFKVGKY
jgi:hypothetical protein